MYLIAFPLLLVPFVLYHMVVFLLGLPLETTVFSVPVLSGSRVPVNIGEALVMLAALLVYLEFLKFSRLSVRSVMDHLLSVVLFGIMVFEFVSQSQMATGPFLVLIVLGFVEVIGGLSIGSSFAPAQRFSGQASHMSAAE
jgi:hypothetical protein